MKKLEMKQMEGIEGGSSCDTVTGIFCGLTAILVFSAVFAPLAGATGTGCILGLASGCGNQ